LSLAFFLHRPRELRAPGATDVSLLIGQTLARGYCHGMGTLMAKLRRLFSKKA
jgi:hypothetical protein